MDLRFNSVSLKRHAFPDIVGPALDDDIPGIPVYHIFLESQQHLARLIPPKPLINKLPMPNREFGGEIQGIGVILVLFIIPPRDTVPHHNYFFRGRVFFPAFAHPDMGIRRIKKTRSCRSFQLATVCGYSPIKLK